MFTAPLPIPGIDLRLIEDRHIDDLYDCVRRNLEHLKPWMRWATDTLTLEDCRQNRRNALERLARNDGVEAGIFDGGRVVGVIGLHGIDWVNRKTTLGYWLSASHVGRGIMTAAVRTFVGHCFDELKLNRVEIRCAPENHRSRAIPRRLGFREEGIAGQAERHQDGRFGDLVSYAMLASEWRSTGPADRLPAADPRG